MRLLGCLGGIFVLALVAAEAFSFVVASRLLTTHARDLIGGSSWVDSVLPIILAQVVLMTIGVVAVKRALARLPTALMGTLMGQNADAGRLAFRVVGGILLIIPGFFLDVLGLILLAPPVQSLFAKAGSRIMLAVVRQKMGKMFAGGGFPGMPGAGMPAGGFPGLRPRGPLIPDERLPRTPGKIVDTTAERVDGGP